MRIASLGSGSKGNALLVQHRDMTLMIDCGFSAKELAQRLRRFGLHLQHIDALLITHEHGDHIRGLKTFLNSYSPQVYMTHGTQRASGIDERYVTIVTPGEDIIFGDLTIKPVLVPHDASEPCQYILQTPKHCLGVLTDLGTISAHVEDHYAACTTLVLEFNHDREMLDSGPYPVSLKKRVGGPWGHLSNCQAQAFLDRTLQHKKLSRLIAAHISEKNNCHITLDKLLEPYCAHVPHIHLANQNEGFDWLPVT